MWKSNFGRLTHMLDGVELPRHRRDVAPQELHLHYGVEVHEGLRNLLGYPNSLVDFPHRPRPRRRPRLPRPPPRRRWAIRVEIKSLRLGNSRDRDYYRNSSLSNFSAMELPCWFRRAVRNRHRHAIEQASRRWRGGRRDGSARTRREILIYTHIITS